MQHYLALAGILKRSMPITTPSSCLNDLLIRLLGVSLFRPYMITWSRFAASHRTASNYVNPSQTKAAIRNIVEQTQRDAPFVLTFETDPKIMELVASMTTRLDDSRIWHVVQGYLRYATFSHTWEGAEPLFHDVLHESVHKLAALSTVLKLVMFYMMVREAELRWAWCDACCINKADGLVFQESLTSTFQWYHASSLTIVHLKGVQSDSELGALERSLWNTRVWTF